MAALATFGDLRAAISDLVRKAVIGEITHDLTKTPNYEIPEHLNDVPTAASAAQISLYVVSESSARTAKSPIFSSGMER